MVCSIGNYHLSLKNIRPKKHPKWQHKVTMQAYSWQELLHESAEKLVQSLTQSQKSIENP